MSQETWKTHFDDDPSIGGVPTATRLESCHSGYLLPPFRQRSANDLKAVLMLGAPASGKSHIAKVFTTGGPFLTIDPDDAKHQLPEYQAWLEVGEARAAQWSHEESSWLARQRRYVGVARTLNLLIDMVGSDPAKVLSLVAELLRSSYSVSVICVHVLDVSVLLKRALKRFDDTGRFVPEDFIKTAHAAVPASFAAVSGRAAYACLIDGTTRAPAWTRSGGISSVQNPAFVASFEAASGALPK